MLKLAEFKQKADRLSDLLPWAALVAPGVVLNKDGSFMRVIQYRGPDLQSSTEPQLVVCTARLNNALKRLGSGWAVFVEARRHHAVGYPQDGAFEDAASWLVDTERRNAFEHEGNHFESDYFLTLQYLPPTETVSKMSKWFVKSEVNVDNQNYHKTLEFFNTSFNQVFDILKDFMFATACLDDVQTLTYLHDCISTKSHVIRVPDVPMYLDSILADSPLTGGLEPKLGDWHIRTVSVMGFPSSSVPAILDQLNHLPMEYRWVTRFMPLDKGDAEKTLKSYRRRWFSKRKGILTLLSEAMSKSESQLIDSGALKKSQDADMAMQELSEDHVSFGFFTATITVWGESPDQVYDKQREVERVMGGLGFATVLETVNAVEAWLSSLPGHTHANVRMPLVHTLNLAHMIPFSSPWAGFIACQHLKGPPLCYAKTSGNMPFRLSSFIGDVGHQMIIGPTGSGKSVLLNLMSLQFLRYPKAQVFVFDKGGSFAVSTYAVDGHLYEVGSEKSGGLVFQPFARVDEESERVWAAEWLAGVLDNENINITPEVKEHIWDALTNLANVPVKQRTFTGLRALIQNSALRQALDPYILGGSYGGILDADEHIVDEKKFQCFEMEKLMQMPQVIAAVLSYIFHVLEARFEGNPTMMILDEAWIFLDHPIFAKKIKEWLKTLRKKNVAVIFATQSVDDAISSAVASTLIESCPSRIFLPNDRALEPKVTEAYLELGLNERQIQILAHAVPKKEYYFQSHVGNALFDLDLGEVAFALCAASSVPDRKSAAKLYDKDSLVGDFVKAWLEKKGIHWAVKLLRERSGEQYSSSK